ncbi:alpha-(1,3)-fucosyltransferase 7 isoform X1 [Scophthalmus maximus]|uniref:alpha-(1,3)-fucosyltransferase 7 isoform X1 n=2 Tax=Scophthalmus maximus TaxID=52904 RepID=UPI001FA8704B|nr:alpha-(1,3)-fucosyltransferase 7 isoform X1 [Scophthalmus maximus]XP_035463132.2 alpha-(1,3)-fucosyltransferase 7 isoform X1 [Scophthalmus maximus]XP_035463136.2 alpha-(1,3)-fucosyltransferase 7 isoform X1 [Scophthalmus maximus]XP_047185624.1 alpha-(1,3)-fucosyltransferase 7 isoform X1 [Scophthalmus maximus]
MRRLCHNLIVKEKSKPTQAVDDSVAVGESSLYWKSLADLEDMMGGENTKRSPLGLLKKCILFSFLFVLMLGLYNGSQRGFQALKPINPSTSFDNRTSSSRNLTILLWYWPFHTLDNLKSDVCWDVYRIPRCKLVDQRSLFSSADVVVFHNRELMSGYEKLPLDLQRPHCQKWAWMSLEAPAHNGNLQPYAGIFNMTMTYRRDSDVTIPYGELLPREAEGQLVQDDFQNKSSLVCWVVSNYQSHYKRSKVYSELKAVVPVKVYGQWTKTPLKSSALLPTISRCYFYLAFENSVAKDYITEKLWKNAYQGGAVPVVLGPPLSDYQAVAPPNSFIHVDEFASVKDLGKYLEELAKDKKRYSEYFAWKQHWEVKLYTDWRERLCKICPRYNDLPQQKVYSDLTASDK